MSRAFRELFGIADAFTAIQIPGRTDSWLLASALDIHRIPLDDPRVSRFRETYLRRLAIELEQGPPPGARNGILPGVRALLDALAASGAVYLGLLTGNYEIAAHLKLDHFDLWRYFGCGALGDDAPDRNVLLTKAIARVAACGGPSVLPGDAVIIGDTPFDVAVARHGGARSVAVATGTHNVDDLRASGADVVLDDLSNTAAVLAAIRT